MPYYYLIPMWIWQIKRYRIFIRIYRGWDVVEWLLFISHPLTKLSSSTFRSPHPYILSLTIVHLLYRFYNMNSGMRFFLFSFISLFFFCPHRTVKINDKCRKQVVYSFLYSLSIFYELYLSLHSYSRGNNSTQNINFNCWLFF